MDFSKMLPFKEKAGPGAERYSSVVEFVPDMCKASPESWGTEGGRAGKVSRHWRVSNRRKRSLKWLSSVKHRDVIKIIIEFYFTPGSFATFTWSTSAYFQNLIGRKVFIFIFWCFCLSFIYTYLFFISSVMMCCPGYPQTPGFNESSFNLPSG